MRRVLAGGGRQVAGLSLLGYLTAGMCQDGQKHVGTLADGICIWQAAQGLGRRVLAGICGRLEAVFGRRRKHLGRHVPGWAEACWQVGRCKVSAC